MFAHRSQQNTDRVQTHAKQRLRTAPSFLPTLQTVSVESGLPQRHRTQLVWSTACSRLTGSQAKCHPITRKRVRLKEEESLRASLPLQTSKISCDPPCKAICLLTGSDQSFDQKSNCEGPLAMSVQSYLNFFSLIFKSWIFVSLERWNHEH